MNVWLVTTAEPLPIDPGVRLLRTGMLAAELVARGHDVTWWTSAFDHQRRTMAAADGATLTFGPRYRARLLRGLGYTRNISIRRYIDHRIVARRFSHYAQAASRPDLVVASMPDHHLAYAAARHARLHGVPYVVDVRDLWPDIFVERAPGPVGRRIARWVLADDFRRLRFQLRHATAVVAVSAGYLRWAIARAERSARSGDRVFFIGQRRASSPPTPLPERVESWLSADGSRKLFAFFGTFGHSYELGLVLEVAKRVHAAGRTDIAFVFAGDGEQRQSIEAAARALPNVLYCGWLGRSQLESILARSCAGLAPCRSVADTVPNKVFEYAGAGLPVISSLEGEMAMLVDQHQLGINYSPGDVLELEAAVYRLADNDAFRETVVERVKAFYLAYGDADRIYRDYADLIETLRRTTGV